MVELDLRLGRPVAPRDAVRAVGRRRGDGSGTGAANCGELVVVEVGSSDAGVQSAQPVFDVQRDLEALRPCSAAAWALRERRVRIDVRRRRGRTPSRRPSSRPGCAPCSWSKRRRCRRCAWSSPVMTTTAFSPRGKYQKRGSGLRSAFIVHDQVREQPLLLVGLRDRDLVEVDPVGLSPGWRRRTGRRSGSGRLRRRAPGRPTPGCPGGCRRPSARGRT